MKISIGAKLFDGPWGGGNLFVKNLKLFIANKPLVNQIDKKFGY